MAGNKEKTKNRKGQQQLFWVGLKRNNKKTDKKQKRDKELKKLRKQLRSQIKRCSSASSCKAQHLCALLDLCEHALAHPSAKIKGVIISLVKHGMSPHNQLVYARVDDLKRELQQAQEQNRVHRANERAHQNAVAREQNRNRARERHLARCAEVLPALLDKAGIRVCGDAAPDAAPAWQTLLQDIYNYVTPADHHSGQEKNKQSLGLKVGLIRLMGSKSRLQRMGLVLVLFAAARALQQPVPQQQPPDATVLPGEWQIPAMLVVHDDKHACTFKHCMSIVADKMGLRLLLVEPSRGRVIDYGDSIKRCLKQIESASMGQRASMVLVLSASALGALFQHCSTVRVGLLVMLQTKLGMHRWHLFPCFDRHRVSSVMFISTEGCSQSAAELLSESSTASYVGHTFGDRPPTTGRHFVVHTTATFHSGLQIGLEEECKENFDIKPCLYRSDTPPYCPPSARNKPIGLKVSGHDANAVQVYAKHLEEHAYLEHVKSGAEQKRMSRARQDAQREARHDDCPICLKSSKHVVKLGCGHCFCKQCLQNHCEHSQLPIECPFCKRHISDTRNPLAIGIEWHSLDPRAKFVKDAIRKLLEKLAGDGREPCKVAMFSTEQQGVMRALYEDVKRDPPAKCMEWCMFSSHMADVADVHGGGRLPWGNIVDAQQSTLCLLTHQNALNDALALLTVRHLIVLKEDWHKYEDLLKQTLGVYDRSPHAAGANGPLTVHLVQKYVD